MVVVLSLKRIIKGGPSEINILWVKHYLPTFY